MENILTKIIAAKQEEVIQLKKLTPVQINTKTSSISLIQRLKSSTSLSIIAEIKRASPSKGAIDLNVDPVSQAISYEKNGATAISILTDGPFFKGSMEDLAAVRKAVNLPLLCKDFIIDEIQIDRAKQAGANVILLIVAALSPDRLVELYQYAKSQELEVLTEVHNEEELNQILPLNPELIGINNRNLKTFEVDISITERLGSELKKAGKIFISESGMKVKEDVIRVAEAGAKGILVGETLMKAKDLEKTFKDLQIKYDGVQHGTY